jgi:hypothetical protein
MGTLNNLIDYKKIKKLLLKNPGQKVKVASPDQPMEIWLVIYHDDKQYPGNGWGNRVLVKKGTAQELDMVGILIPDSCDLEHPVNVVQFDTNSSINAEAMNNMVIFRVVPELSKEAFLESYLEHLRRILEYLDSQTQRFASDLNQLTK